MSSLMQHRGAITKRGVELLMYLETTEEYASCDQCGKEQDLENAECAGCGKKFAQRFRHDGNPMEVLIPYEDRAQGSGMGASIGRHSRTFDTEPVELVRPNGTRTTCAKLYRVFRKPAGMFGCWVVFRWNGAEHVPDLSVPIGVKKLPRDAQALSNEEASRYWFTEN